VKNDLNCLYKVPAGQVANKCNQMMPIALALLPSLSKYLPLCTSVVFPSLSLFMFASLSDISFVLPWHYLHLSATIKIRCDSGRLPRKRQQVGRERDGWRGVSETWEAIPLLWGVIAILWFDHVRLLLWLYLHLNLKLWHAHNGHTHTDRPPLGAHSHMYSRTCGKPDCLLE